MGDGYGDSTNSIISCAPPLNHVDIPMTVMIQTIRSQAPELCDGISNTCAANPPANEVDNDGDGYVECTSTVVDGMVSTGGGDCDDTDAIENPTVLVCRL